METTKFLDLVGLKAYDAQIKSQIAVKVDKEDGKGLSTNDFTDAEKEKLSGLSNFDATDVLLSTEQELSNAQKLQARTNIGAHDGDYTTLTNAPVIPTTVAQLSDSSDYATVSALNSAISGLGDVLTYKGTQPTVGDLPSTGNATGDVWFIVADGSEYAWNGSAWEEFGTSLDVSGFYTTENLVAITTTEIDAMFA